MCGQRGSFGGEEGEKVLELIGAPCGIRTHGPRIRNPAPPRELFCKYLKYKEVSK